MYWILRRSKKTGSSVIADDEIRTGSGSELQNLMEGEGEEEKSEKDGRRRKNATGTSSKL